MNRISKLKILQGVPFGIYDNKVLTFDSQEEQVEFFERFTSEELCFENLTFVKGFLNKKIKIDVPIGYIEFANYLMFNNEEVEPSKWFYAFITGFEYVSDNCTYITIEIDYFQSYMGDIIFIAGNIDRQMTTNDNLYIAENLEGEPINVNQYIKITNKEVVFKNWVVCVLYKPNLVIEGVKTFFGVSGFDIDGSDTYNYRDLKNDPHYSGNYNEGNFIPNKYMTGCAVLTYKISNLSDLQEITTKLWTLELMGYSVNDVYMIPSQLQNNLTADYEVECIKNPFYTNKTINMGYYDYKPINAKCFTSPYIYIELSNFDGGKVKYRMENFFPLKSTGVPNFSFRVLLNSLHTMEGIIYPINYLSVIEDYKQGFEYGLELGETPKVVWNENAAGQELIKKGLNAAAIGIGAAVGVPEMAAMLPKGYSDTKNKEAVFVENPDLQMVGAAGIALQTSISNCDESQKGRALPILQTIFNFVGWKFTLYACINIAQVDEYFSLYGYKMSGLRTPNILGNARWNFVKMVNATVLGAIPLEAKNAIIDKLNNGITFWHDLINFQYGADLSTNTITGKRLNNGKIFQH